MAELASAVGKSTADIKFAIVGCGLIGGKRFAALPKDSLVATCDPMLERAQALASKAGNGCIAVPSVEDIFPANPDAVIISTINNSLAPLAATCIKAGKHVLVEKPGAISLAEVEGLIQLAEAHKVKVRIGFNHRYHPAFQKAREIFESGALGPLMFIRARYGHGGRIGYDREWRADPKLSGGGELMDQGVHLIDLAGWFLGQWTTIEGHASTFFWDMPVDDNAFLSLRNSQGNTAWLQVSCSEWKNLFSFEIYGRNAKLHIEGLGGSYGIERLYHYQMLPEMGPPDTTIYEFPRGDSSWAIETRDFVEDILFDRPSVPGLAEARASMEVVESIYASSGYSV
jgi:predicted dehydrogenase